MSSNYKPVTFAGVNIVYYQYYYLARANNMPQRLSFDTLLADFYWTQNLFQVFML